MHQTVRSKALVAVALVGLFGGCNGEKDEPSPDKAGGDSSVTALGEPFRRIDDSTFLVPSRCADRESAEKSLVESLAKVFQQNPTLAFVRISPVDVEYSNGFRDGPFILDGVVITAEAPSSGRTVVVPATANLKDRGYYSAGEGVFLIPGRNSDAVAEQLAFAQAIANLKHDIPSTARAPQYSLGGHYSNGFSDGEKFINGLIVIDRAIRPADN
jgi:hypothetical protein